MVQPKYDPSRVLNLRVTPELRRRLDELLATIPTGAAKLSRHGLAVWCLERGLSVAERDPAATMRPAGAELDAHDRRNAAQAALLAVSAGGAVNDAHEDHAPKAPSRPRKASSRGAENIDHELVARTRTRLVTARDRGIKWSEISRRTDVQPSGLRRFTDGVNATLLGDGLARVNAALTELGVP